MNTVELINLLQKMLRENGDLPVVIRAHDGWSSVKGVKTAIPVTETLGAEAREYVDQKAGDLDHDHVNAIF